MFNKKLLLVFLCIIAVSALMITGQRLLSKTSTDFPGFIDNNIVINSKIFTKTSEVVVIPKKGKAVIRSSDNSSWNSIVSETVGETWRGVFIKDRKVTINPFSLAQYPVTQELFTEVMGFNPSYFKKENLNIKYSYACTGENPDLRPVETVSWFDAVVFCNMLTLRTMQKSDCVYYADSTCLKVYTIEDAQRRTNPVCNNHKKGYRLPTEAEWEFAARGGNTAGKDWLFAFSGTESDRGRIVYDSNNYSFIDSNLDQYGWYRENSSGVTHEVGTKRPNALGLYDMSGSVWEWLYDWYDNTVYPGNAKNPYGAPTGTDRVLRGGSWFEDAYGCCVTRRFHNAHPYIPHFYFGFRYCRSL